MSFGYLIIVNSQLDDRYIDMAYSLALSIKLTQPEGYEKVALIIDDASKVNVKSPWVFNEIVEASMNEFWDCRSQMYDLSPWDETICLDADMLFTKDISRTVDFLIEHFEIFLPSKVFDYRDREITNTSLRKASVLNDIPLLYSMFTFFKKAKNNEDFFQLVNDITDYKVEFSNLYFSKYKPKVLGTDEIFGLATKILGTRVTFDTDLVKILHMKGELQGWFSPSLKATNKVGFYLDENGKIMVGSYQQHNIVHYVEKDLMTEEYISILEDNVWKK